MILDIFAIMNIACAFLLIRESLRNAGKLDRMEREILVLKTELEFIKNTSAT